jgi:hypothetical protein
VHHVFLHPHALHSPLHACRCALLERERALTQAAQRKRAVELQQLLTYELHVLEQERRSEALALASKQQDAVRAERAASVQTQHQARRAQRQAEQWAKEVRDAEAARVAQFEEAERVRATAEVELERQRRAAGEALYLEQQRVLRAEVQEAKVSSRSLIDCDKSRTEFA